MNGFTPEAVDMREVGQHWGWFLALGIFLIIVGTLALGSSMAVTLFSMIFLGWLMILAGVVEAVHAFWKKEWGGPFFTSPGGGPLHRCRFYDVGQPRRKRFKPDSYYGHIFYFSRTVSDYHGRGHALSPLGLGAL